MPTARTQMHEKWMQWLEWNYKMVNDKALPFSQRKFSKPLKLPKLWTRTIHFLLNMDILKPIKDKFILFCVCPSNLQNPLIKYRNRAFSMFCSIVLMTFFFTSAAYILKHFKDDLEGCLLAMLSGSASLGLISMMMAAHLLQNQVTDIFSDFTVTCDKCK